MTDATFDPSVVQDSTPRKPRRRVAWIATVTAAVLIFCGAIVGIVALVALRDGPADVVNNYLAAVRAGDSPSRYLCDGPAGRSLPEQVSTRLPRANWKITEERQHRRTAQVRVRIASGEARFGVFTVDFRLIKENGWKICGLQSPLAPS